MKSLTGSYLKFFPYKYGEKDRMIWCPREVVLSRKEIGFLGYQKRIVLGLSLSASFHCKTIDSISAVASALSSENQTHVESEEIEVKNTAYTDEPKTAHVRFKLHKECTFGQQFLIVGDDPILGLWDPSDGVPFIWSDGHVWTAELDVPCGKVIKYKFILKVNTETISWQPGPDRILETWDTENTITVFEDWDNPELQNIMEEEGLIADVSEESLMNSELLIVAENLTQSIQEEGIDVHKQLASTNGYASLAEKKVEDKGKQDLNTCVNYTKHEEGVIGNDDREVNGSDLFSSKDEGSLVSKEEVPVLVPGLIPMLTEETDLFSSKDEGSLVSKQEVPVLVPGLIPMLTEETEVLWLDEVEKQNVANSSIGSDEAEELNVQELKDERISALLHPTETSEIMNEKNQELYGKEQLEILEGDMNWGRRTFQKFLANLGFEFHY